MPDDRHHDWIETLTALAGFFGLNKVRVRWKLMQWRESYRDARHRARVAKQSVGYRHKLCPSCGSVEHRENKVCSRCATPLYTHVGQIVRRMGLVSPHLNSVSTLLSFAIVVVYGCMMRFEPGGGLADFNDLTLLQFGAHDPNLVEAGEVWRLSTAIFLHIGLAHLAFNLIALQQIGPQIEEVFGKGRMLFFFMVTGILANVASEMMGLDGIAAGASGALMGLIGVAAGWGQRDGSTFGKDLRNRMINWLVYTVVFGFMINADNSAHVGGFLVGGLFGYLSRPQWETPGRPPLVHRLMGILGLLLAIATLVLVFHPPFSMMDKVYQ